MDPITAVGVAATIVQLSQAALSLSKTLYSLGAAISSASDDIRILADELETFSQSLTVLSRLLDDNKSWYSDDVYLLTAKIIKDCADLYIKIDKMLRKLSGNSTWKLRIKFVYKGSEIQKLMGRLRDMKGTLATILMSLQIDLQLSLLNISSPSKIQRPPESQLRPETIETLTNAQIAQQMAMRTPFFTINSVNSELAIGPSTGVLGELNPQNAVTLEVSSSDNRITLIATQSDPNSLEPRQIENTGSDNTAQVFDTASTKPIPSVQQEIGSGSTRGIEERDSAQEFPSTINFTALNHANPSTIVAGMFVQDNDARSLRSVASVQTFKSALSAQEPVDIAPQVKGVYDVLHSFRTALEVLATLIERRLQNQGQDIHAAATKLENSLAKGEAEISELHSRYFKLSGQFYTTAFKPTHTTELENISSKLLKDVVVVLHASSATHVETRTSDFEPLHACSEQCRIQTISLIFKVTSQATPRFYAAPPMVGWHGNTETLIPPSGGMMFGIEREAPQLHEYSRYPRGAISARSPKMARYEKAPSSTRDNIYRPQPDIEDQHDSSQVLQGSPIFSATDAQILETPRVPLAVAEEASDARHLDNVPDRMDRSQAARQIAENRKRHREDGESMEDFAEAPPATSMPYMAGGSDDSEPRDKRARIWPEIPGEAERTTGPHLYTSQRRDKTMLPPGELTSLHPVWSQAPFKALWLDAYTHLENLQPTVAAATRDSIREKLGSFFLESSDEDLSEAITSLVKKTSMNEHSEAAEWFKQIIGYRGNIIKVVMTVSSNLGLSRPVVGWSCLVVLLEITNLKQVYEGLFVLAADDGADISEVEFENILKTFQQLNELVGLLARYAVMENLYHQLPAFRLTEEYRAALRDICVAIVTYFAHAFTVAHILRDPEGDREKAAESRRKCEELIETIKEKDEAGRRFRVVVEADEWNEGG